MWNKNATVIKDVDGNNIVMINDIVFKGKRNVNWNEVKGYLKGYIGEFYTIDDTSDIIWIGTDLPDEFTGSKYTYSLKGAVAKAKANAATAIPELIEIAYNKNHTDNKKIKHNLDAANGWYRYDSRFALPVYNDIGEVERYNVFHVYLIIRHDFDGKMYLYDILNIKKKRATRLATRINLARTIKTHFLFI